MSGASSPAFNPAYTQDSSEGAGYGGLQYSPATPLAAAADQPGSQPGEGGEGGQGEGSEGVPRHSQISQQNFKSSQLIKLRQISQEYELHGGAVVALRKLEGYDIVVLCDDSGSMNSPVTQGDGSRADPFAPRPTRWHELKARVIQILRIATSLDDDGIDIYFLNRAGKKNVTDEKDVEKLFKAPPNGYTPLREAYYRIMAEQKSEKRTLLVIATDGEPNAQDASGTWRLDSQPFAHALKTRPRPAFTPVVIMVCTDNEDEVAWLNGLDDVAPNVDVVDDYASERREVMKTQGAGFPFTVGDYVVKSLLGAVNPLYDKLDEVKLTRKEKAAYLGLHESEVPLDKSSEGGCVLQ
eukprot:gb/GEZN01009828.1/.p1 GENE.gb/GEZN01009828.1/~~gb/GEZN01009828.1/.p1  ORF type:complete len:353 (+),score=34.86 gb/GEZN01009828.1/:21-1079(+)